MIATVSHRTYARLTAPEIATELDGSTILCLPIGSLEQHGPHLPINTDTVLAERFACCLAHVRPYLLPDDFAIGADQAEQIKQTVLDRATSRPWSSNDPALAVHGVTGNDPRGATAALGRTLLATALHRCADVIDRVTWMNEPASTGPRRANAAIA